MKKLTVLILFTAVILTGLINSCQGIQCNVCNTALQKDCDMLQMPSKYLVNCSASTAHSVIPDFRFNETVTLPNPNWEQRFKDLQDATDSKLSIFFCRKQVVIIPQQDNSNKTHKYFRDGETRVVRSCGYIEPGKKTFSTCKNVNSASLKIRQCECNDRDACNQGHLSVAHYGMFSVLILTYSWVAFVILH